MALKKKAAVYVFHLLHVLPFFLFLFSCSMKFWVFCFFSSFVFSIFYYSDRLVLCNGHVLAGPHLAPAVETSPCYPAGIDDR